jgi:phosphoribosyl 1,2-cyclic phosphodiesterase
VLNVTFHGVRGSTPVCGPDVVRYGGNTSCVVIEGAGAEPIVLDLGTGLRRYGAAHGRRPFVGTALLSHLHWDHVQGLPFFAPVLLPGAHLQVLGPAPEELPTLRAAFDTLMQPPFFPVTIDRLAGVIEVDHVPTGPFRVGDATVLAREIPHTGRALGFRITAGGRTIAYLPDHQQPADASFCVPDAVLELCEGADLLVHDAQYLPEEFALKSDWGHCTMEFALMVAKVAGARRLALFHHDPVRSDDALDEQAGCARLAGRRLGVDVIAAAEGMQLRL